MSKSAVLKINFHFCVSPFSHLPSLSPNYMTDNIKHSHQAADLTCIKPPASSCRASGAQWPPREKEKEALHFPAAEQDQFPTTTT